MTDELKPCPFCGKDMQRRDYTYEGYTVYCTNCGAIGPNELTEKRADEMWNLRRPEYKLLAQLAARDALIERIVEDYLTHYERDEFGEVKTRCLICGANDNETYSLIHKETCPVPKWELLTHKSNSVSLKSKSETQSLGSKSGEK